MRKEPVLSIDCALLGYAGNNFLLPTQAMAEIVLLEICQAKFTFSTKATFCLGTFPWRGLAVPVISLDLSLLQISCMLHPKMAVIHALFSAQCPHPAFFIFLFEGKTRKLKIAEHELSWLDQKNKKALLLKNEEHTEVTLVDLYHISTEVEKILSPI